MPAPLRSLPGNASFDARQAAFEADWRDMTMGRPLRWEDYLPAAGQPCTPGFVFLLVQTDIEFRVQRGLPALLAEPYFAHPRLQAPDAALPAAQQMELIRWEYQQRWQHGERAARQDYIERFPQHAAALQELKPRWSCPGCKRLGALEDEAAETATCAGCNAGHAVADLFPAVAPPPGPAAAPASCAIPPPGPSLVRPRRAPSVRECGLDLRDYELLEPLGRGGMGEVYRSRDPGLGRDLALKVLNREWQGHAEMEQRFEAEARITGSLQHPAIVPVYNLGRLPDGRLYFTMKVVRGRTFQDILDEPGAIAAERRAGHLGVFEQVCQAVAYAHSKGVIHRDLRPSNVMVGRFGEVQVMDWGLAKLLKRAGQAEAETAVDASALPGLLTEQDRAATRGGVGTPGYMAPEQASGEWERVDERVDVFALGAILCAILTGEPPYRGDNWREVQRKAQRGDLADANARMGACGADAALVQLARECLSPEMAGRPRDAGTVAERVTAYLASVQERLRRAEVEPAAAQARAEEAAAKAEAEAAKAAAERRARRMLLGLAAVVLLLVLVGGAGAWLVQQQQAAA